MTVQSVQVSKGKATELNFTLEPVVSEPSGGTTSSPLTTITTSSSNSSQTKVNSSEGQENTPSVLPSEYQPIQPQKFRHHNYEDMELFLRKYSGEFPSIAHLYSVGRSVEDKVLYVMVISDNPKVHEHGTIWPF